METLIAENKEKQSEISSLKAEVKSMKAEVKCVKAELVGVSGTLNQLVKMQQQLANHLLLPQVEPLPTPTHAADEPHEVMRDNEIELVEKVSGSESAEVGRDGEEETEDDDDDDDDVSMAVVSVPASPAAQEEIAEDNDANDTVDDDEPVVVPTKKRKKTINRQRPVTNAFFKMRANQLTQTMAEKNIFSGYKVQPMGSFIYDVADRRMLSGIRSKNPLKIQWKDKDKEGREYLKVKRMLNFLLDMCETEEDFVLLAAKDPPLYGDSDPALVRSRRERIEKLSRSMTTRLHAWCNENMADLKKKLDIGKFKAGQLQSRIDRQGETFHTSLNLTNILNKKRPAAASLEE